MGFAKADLGMPLGMGLPKAWVGMEDTHFVNNRLQRGAGPGGLLCPI